MDKRSFKELNKTVSSIFESEPAVVMVDCPSAIIVGDLHGNLEALDFILEIGKKLDCSKYIFLGDYVYRADHSVEVLCRLFRLKVDRPDDVILLRSNHETEARNLFYNELRSELGKDNEMFNLVNRTFEMMPIAAVLNGKTFCVHGGIGKPVTLDQIKKEECHAYLWNHPQEENGLKGSSEEFGAQVFGAQVFGQDICKEFMRLNGLSMMITAHTELWNGHRWCFDGDLLSISSTPEYCGLDNEGAFVFIEQKQMVSIDRKYWLNEELTPFVFGMSGDASYSLLGVVSSNSDELELDAYDSTTSITFDVKTNSIMTKSVMTGNCEYHVIGKTFITRYIFTEPNAIEMFILECRSFGCSYDLDYLLEKYPHVCESLEEADV